ncbi:MAG TPA: SAF domain-containing protein, partial [Thermoanaerobaculia bacterium]|nr:SAF domain-containing protein [Thermoanaerobaculia bacterium]
MARLRDLPLDPLAKRWLREEKLDTSEDLWRSIGTQYEKGMDGLHKRTGIARDRLVHALGAAADADPGRRMTLGKALFAVLVLALAALVGLRVAEAFDLFPFPLSGLTATLDQTVVVPRHGLPAFHGLTENDLRLAPRPRTAGGITRKTDAVGRYLLRPKRSGAVLRAEDL